MATASAYQKLGVPDEDEDGVLGGGYDSLMESPQATQQSNEGDGGYPPDPAPSPSAPAPASPGGAPAGNPVPAPPPPPPPTPPIGATSLGPVSSPAPMQFTEPDDIAIQEARAQRESRTTNTTWNQTGPATSENGVVTSTGYGQPTATVDPVRPSTNIGMPQAYTAFVDPVRPSANMGLPPQEPTAFVDPVRPSQGVGGLPDAAPPSTSPVVQPVEPPIDPLGGLGEPITGYDSLIPGAPSASDLVSAPLPAAVPSAGAAPPVEDPAAPAAATPAATEAPAAQSPAPEEAPERTDWLDTYRQGEAALSASLDRARTKRQRQVLEQMAARGTIDSSVEAGAYAELEADLAAQEQHGLFQMQQNLSAAERESLQMEREESRFSRGLAEQIAGRMQQESQFARGLSSTEAQNAIANALAMRAQQLQALGQDRDEAYRNAALESDRQLRTAALRLQQQGMQQDDAYRYAALEQDERFRTLSAQLQERGMRMDEAYRYAALSQDREFRTLAANLQREGMQLDEAFRRAESQLQQDRWLREFEERSRQFNEELELRYPNG